MCVIQMINKMRMNASISALAECFPVARAMSIMISRPFATHFRSRQNVQMWKTTRIAIWLHWQALIFLFQLGSTAMNLNH